MPPTGGGGGGTAIAVTGTGGGIGTGTVMTVWHDGHCTVCPACSSGTLKPPPHDGQDNVIGMGVLSFQNANA